MCVCVLRYIRECVWYILKDFIVIIHHHRGNQYASIRGWINIVGIVRRNTCKHYWWKSILKTVKIRFRYTCDKKEKELVCILFGYIVKKSHLILYVFEWMRIVSTNTFIPSLLKILAILAKILAIFAKNVKIKLENLKTRVGKSKLMESKIDKISIHQKSHL